MKKIIIAAASMLLFANTAMAQNPPRPRLGESCRAEVTALCGSAAGKEARKACMKENRSKLSEGCSAELKANRQARMKVRQSTPVAPAPEMK